MFTVEIGLVAFFGAAFCWHPNLIFSWLPQQIRLKIYKCFVLFGFLCCVYCIVAGLNLFATGYMDEFTKPAFDKISNNPESLSGVHSPKGGIALVMILLAPVTLLLWGAGFSYVYYIIWRDDFR